MTKLKSVISLIMLCAMVFTSIGGIGYNVAFGVYLEPCEDDCSGECCTSETDCTGGELCACDACRVAEGCTGDEFCACEECSSIDDSLSTGGSLPDTAPAYETLGITEIQQFVSRLYQYALDRPYEIAGRDYWVNRLTSNTSTGASIAYDFFFSNEFKNANHSDDEFVKRLYKALFDRDADAGGKAYWLYQLSIGMPRESILAGLTASQEFTKLCAIYDINRGSYTYTPPKSILIRAFVTRLYIEVLDRTPDNGGLNYWAGLLTNGTSGESVAYNFFFSNEFRNRHLGSGEIVDILYKTLLNREPDAAGRANWVNRLDTGWPLENVFAGFANSTEFNGICQQAGIVRGTYTPPVGGLQRAFVTRLYDKALGRSPDTAGLNAWTNRLMSGTTGAQVACELIFSMEMLNRNLDSTQFVNMLYEALFARSADTTGRTFWVNQLDVSRVSRYSVFTSFVRSSEFDRHCKDHSIISGSAPAPANTLLGTDIESRVWNLIRRAGVSGISDRPSHVAGIIGNMRCGTGYNLCPFQIHIADQVGLGLLQWTGARQVALENYMWANGISRVRFYEEMEVHKHEVGGYCSNPITKHPDAAFLNKVLQVQVNFMFHEIRTADDGLYMRYIDHPAIRTGQVGAVSYAELFCALAVRSGPGRPGPGSLFDSDTIQDLGVLLALQASPYVGGEGVLNRISFHILGERRLEAYDAYNLYLRSHK